MTDKKNHHDQCLWLPSRQQIEQSRMYRFMSTLNHRHGNNSAALDNYQDLHQWSVNNPAEFWSELWDWIGVISTHKGETVLLDGEQMPGASWFPEARLNYAENLLRHQNDSDALVFYAEDKIKRRLSYHQLYDQVSCLTQALRHSGVKTGDRIAGYMPNQPEAIIAMLAAAALGAVWTSCSPDFGVRGVLDRFGQSAPKVLFTVNAYYYNGKSHDVLAKVGEIAAQLESLATVVVYDFTGAEAGLESIAGAVDWQEFCGGYTAAPIEFVALPFDHPLYILYSSGTTGKPKCIVHGAGGTLLQHLKEHQLHCDLDHGQRLFYFTTCGWMMWNWLVSGLASAASLILYDGSPFIDHGRILWRIAEQEKINIFGTSAKYIDALKKAGRQPGKEYDLSALNSILSTGSPLAPESFDYVYQSIDANIRLSSISGGTDIVSCFALGNPMLPVWRGELQCLGLGMDVRILDDSGAAVEHGEKGELTCATPFPSMPVGFWNDADGSRYHAAYFEKFPGVWSHGDYVAITAHGGVIIYGRSDTVLNPGGVRIGTAEIYRQAELIEEVVESLVIGQRWQADVRVVLFVVLRAGIKLDQDLQDRIRQQIRTNTTPRHVPEKIIQVTDIPRTKSGKIVELAVSHVVHGEAVKNIEALANPGALEQFRNLEELAK